MWNSIGGGQHKGRHLERADSTSIQHKEEALFSFNNILSNIYVWPEILGAARNPPRAELSWSCYKAPSWLQPSGMQLCHTPTWSETAKAYSYISLNKKILTTFSFHKGWLPLCFFEWINNLPRVNSLFMTFLLVLHQNLYGLLHLPKALWVYWEHGYTWQKSPIWQKLNLSPVGCCGDWSGPPTWNADMYWWAHFGLEILTS